MAPLNGVPPSPCIATPLGASGIRGAVTGVTRIGSRAGIVATGILALIVLAIVYGISVSGNHRPAPAAVGVQPQILPTDAPSFDNIPGANPNRQSAPTPDPRYAPRVAQRAPQRVIAVRQAPPVLPDPAAASALRQAPDVPAIQPVSGQVAAQVQQVSQAQSAQAAAAGYAAALKADRARQAQQLADAARHSAIIVSMQTNNVQAAQARSAPVDVATAAPSAQPSPDVATDPIVASQRAKSEFVSQQKSTTADDYQLSPRQAAISQYEVQAGSIIPAVLVTGVNSDLPGTMVGQVSRDVYDSKTGQILLIPAGSKIVGRYDSQVTNGQSRVLVAWQRIIFPDASFIDISGMAGTDTAGYAGFTGKVDDHSGKLFRNAILFSLIGAGATLLQPRTALTALTPVGMVATTPTVGSQVAGQVGSQIAQTAQQVTQQGLQQQPTIEVRPGYLFNILVDRDLVLPAPYAR